MRWQRLSVARKTPGFDGALSCISEIQLWTSTTLRTSCNSREFFREVNRHRMDRGAHAFKHEADMGKPGRLACFCRNFYLRLRMFSFIAPMALVLGDYEDPGIEPQSAFWPTRSLSGIGG